MVRLKNRYIVVEVIFDKKKSGQLPLHPLLPALKKSIRDLYGVQGLGLTSADLKTNYMNRDTGVAFVQMRRSAYKIVSSSLAMITSMNGEPCSIKSLYTGATLLKCSAFLRCYQRRQVELAFASLKSDVQRKKLELEVNTSIDTFRNEYD